MLATPGLKHNLQRVEGMAATHCLIVQPPCADCPGLVRVLLPNHKLSLYLPAAAELSPERAPTSDLVFEIELLAKRRR